MTAEHDNLAILSAANAEFRAAMNAMQRGISRLEQAYEAIVEQGVQSLPSPMVPVSDHRREHRPGPPPKIVGDPELQTFIAARVDRMTFIEIAADVAGHFPPERRVGKSAIYDWWKKQSSRKAGRR